MIYFSFFNLLFLISYTIIERENIAKKGLFDILGKNHCAKLLFLFCAFCFTFLLLQKFAIRYIFDFSSNYESKNFLYKNILMSDELCR